MSERLAATYVAVGRPVPDAKTLATMAADLASLYTDAQIIAALARVRLECRFIAPVDIIERIPGAGADDGRPGVEEAWALCPKDESSSCVWTEEMMEAFGVARPMLQAGDHVAARMTFKEAYSRALESARREGIPVRWEPSLGWDKSDRVRALTEAVEKKRIRSDAALNLLAPEQADQLLMALPAESGKRMLVGEVRPVTQILTGFAGILQQMRMEGVVPADCDPGPPKPARRAMTPEELEERRAVLRQQAATVLVKRTPEASGDACLPQKDQ
ncbi:MAG: hypothetical protein LAO03_12410 [Acidobacteriia bacterium]|nr:hypothetical protein [Terriglobia bacterium]